jgi:adenylate cyclase
LERRLAAILAADVVGYSRLMGADEAGTLQRLKSLRKELVQPRITERKGRIVKLMGDGLLAEFPSVVEAVQCAVHIQESMIGRESGLPDERRIRLRIGVNLGDIIVEGSDIYGDGVNVAARLEGLAKPGGICVSGTVFDHVKGKVSLDFADLGEQQVKNIDQPVRVYGVALDSRPDTNDGADTITGPAAGLEPPAKPSIAVLPFINMSGDPEQEYFADGITEDIITELSRSRELFVIARNSSFAFKGPAVKVEEIARTLGVTYVVEGSVRKAGNRLRVTAQLIEVTTRSHLWADRYDRELADVFTIQDEITRSIVGRLVAGIEADRLRMAHRKPTASMDAYDCYLRAKALTEKFRVENIDDEIAMYERAIQLDPSFARANAWLSFAYLRRWWNKDEDADLRAACAASRRAVDLDDNDSVCHCAQGFTSLNERKFDYARRHFELALALNPNDADTQAQFCMLLLFTGEPDEAIRRLGDAMQYNPLHPTWYYEVLGYSHFAARRYEEAVTAFRMILDPEPHVLAILAGCLTALGQTDEAKIERAKLLEAQPAFRIDRWVETEPWQSEADLDHLRSLYKAAALPE